MKSVILSNYEREVAAQREPISSIQSLLVTYLEGPCYGKPRELVSHSDKESYCKVVFVEDVYWRAHSAVARLAIVSQVTAKEQGKSGRNGRCMMLRLVYYIRTRIVRAEGGVDNQKPTIVTGGSIAGALPGSDRATRY